jgi:hypothetical protein
MTCLEQYIIPRLLLILLSLELSYIVLSGVGGNLLSSSSSRKLPKAKEINNRSRNDSISTYNFGIESPSSSLLPRPHSKSKEQEAGKSVGGSSEFRFYCDFIGAFSEFNGWRSGARLLIPETGGGGPSPGLCAYFRTTLLGTYGLLTVCMSSNGTSARTSTSSSGGTNGDKKGFSDSDSPIISLHFLLQPAEAGQGGAGVHPNYLIHYRTAREILVVTGDARNEERLIQELQPEPNSNYKWTLGIKDTSEGKSDGPIINIKNVYGFATSSEPLPQSIGFWSPSQGMQIKNSKKLGPDNFMGRLLRITSLEVALGYTNYSENEVI